MLKIKAFFVIFLGLYTTAAVAVDNNIGWKTQEDVSAYSEGWGGGTFTNSCGGQWDQLLSNGDSSKKIPNICIGESEKYCGTAVPKCDGYTFEKDTFLQAREYTDEASVILMAAKDVDSNCGVFCPIQVEAKNKRKQDAWTEYVLLSDNCEYLCRNGFQADNNKGKCDPSDFSKEGYSEIKAKKVAAAAYNEWMALFDRDISQFCDLNTRQRHDVILGVVEWLDSGHGAWVQQLVVRARRTCWKEWVSWPVIYPKDGAQRVLVCKVGYQPNSGNTDCVAIDEAVCEAAAACTGWTTGFDSGFHKYIFSDDDNCYEYRCKESGFAFVSDTDRTCTQCVKNARQGIDKNGLCVECPVGKIINDKTVENFDSKTGDIDSVCDVTGMLTKTDLQYGSGKTKSTAGDLDTQCWTKGDVAEYEKCVIGKE